MTEFGLELQPKALTSVDEIRDSLRSLVLKNKHTEI
jgi:hypothetical protein